MGPRCSNQASSCKLQASGSTSLQPEMTLLCPEPQQLFELESYIFGSGFFFVFLVLMFACAASSSERALLRKKLKQHEFISQARSHVTQKSSKAPMLRASGLTKVANI